jgi:hypothetical protein
MLASRRQILWVALLIVWAPLASAHATAPLAERLDAARARLGRMFGEYQPPAKSIAFAAGTRIARVLRFPAAEESRASEVPLRDDQMKRYTLRFGAEVMSGAASVPFRLSLFSGSGKSKRLRQVEEGRRLGDEAAWALATGDPWSAERAVLRMEGLLARLDSGKPMTVIATSPRRSALR